MQVRLVKFSPYTKNNPKQSKGFADFEITIVEAPPHAFGKDGSQVFPLIDFVIVFKIKGCLVNKRPQSAIMVTMPTLPQLDKDKAPYSPFCWCGKASYEEFLSQARKEFAEKWPPEKWGEKYSKFNQGMRK